MRNLSSTNLKSSESHLSKGAKGGAASGTSNFNLVATAVTAGAFLARAWVAHATFLNADEALHFRLANQASLAMAYRESLTASHPPMLTVVLYYWRALGTSEFRLRTPLVVASAIFCWMFYKWLARVAGQVVGLVGLVMVGFLPPIVALGAEIRQYPLLLMFLAAALFFLESAFEEKSAGKMVAFSACLYGAMLSHYSAFLFAAALGIYAGVRMAAERVAGKVAAAWVIGQAGAAALAVFLYKTHIAKLGVGESRTVLQGWMSDFFLRHSYFDAGRDNPVTFALWHSFGVFQYFFGQLAVGDVMGLAFVVGVVMLARARPGEDRKAMRARELAVLLVVSFAIAAGASLAHVYPYGGTRHVAFLMIPGIAGVSVAIERMSRKRAARAVGIAVLIVVVCVGFGKARRPYMTRADQSKANMTAAIEFLRKNVGPGSVIFTDYESDLILGHYLCDQRPISFEISNAEFEAFTCGQKVVSAGYRAGTNFTAENFVGLRDRMVERYRLQAGETVWVFQAGWDANLPEQLRERVAEFRGLQVAEFGGNVKVFQIRVP